jgi:hypothetical protein
VHRVILCADLSRVHAIQMDNRVQIGKFQGSEATL